MSSSSTISARRSRSSASTGNTPADEIWDCYTYFVKAVLPVAEEAGVKMGLHPDDPPLAKMNGVAKLFVHHDGYRKAEEIAGPSKHWGLTFCIGTWAEGGDQMGKDVFGMIEDFGGRGKIFDVHFRNVSGPLPHFVETFPDDGYLDLAKVMKALRQVVSTVPWCRITSPQLAGDSGIRRAGTAYCIACMRACCGGRMKRSAENPVPTYQFWPVAQPDRSKRIIGRRAHAEQVLARQRGQVVRDNRVGQRQKPTTAPAG